MLFSNKFMILTSLNVEVSRKFETKITLTVERGGCLNMTSRVAAQQQVVVEQRELASFRVRFEGL